MSAVSLIKEVRNSLIAVPFLFRSEANNGGTRGREQIGYQTYSALQQDYLPMQNCEKIESSKSSVEVLPTISPIAFTAIRNSIAMTSSVWSLRKPSIAATVALRARFKAS